MMMVELHSFIGVVPAVVLRRWNKPLLLVAVFLLLFVHIHLRIILFLVGVFLVVVQVQLLLGLIDAAIFARRALLLLHVFVQVVVGAALLRLLLPFLVFLHVFEATFFQVRLCFFTAHIASFCYGSLRSILISAEFQDCTIFIFLCFVRGILLY